MTIRDKYPEASKRSTGLKRGSNGRPPFTFVLLMSLIALPCLDKEAGRY